MQDTIAKNENNKNSKALLGEELKAGDIDLTTAEGRQRRSKKNLQHLAEVHHDCPEELLQELTTAILKKQCTLKHMIWDINIKPETIIESGTLLSNAELKRRNIAVNGGTDGSWDDREELGNHDFVFTFPIFHNADEPIKARRDRFYVPVDDTFLDRYSWLTFKDWAGMLKDDYLDNKQSGKWDDDARLHSVYYDFFTGKKDMSQAAAYKVFEAVKTVMILYADSGQEHGFNRQIATQFLDDVKGYPTRSGQVGNANTLKEPISHYTLSQAQQAFLLDTDNPDRNALIQHATEAILHVMAHAAELKVPVALSLDGATVDSKLLTADLNKRPTRRISYSKNGQYTEVDPDTFKPHQITPQMGFERKVAGFECPD